MIVYRAFIAYVSLQHGIEAEAFFNDHTQLTEVVQSSILSLAIVVGDCLIVSIQHDWLHCTLLYLTRFEDPPFMGRLVPQQTRPCGPGLHSTCAHR